MTHTSPLPLSSFSSVKMLRTILRVSTSSSLRASSMRGFATTIHFTKDHEYVKVEDGGLATVGITDFAQSQLGDVVFVSVPEVGAKFKKGYVLNTLPSASWPHLTAVALLLYPRETRATHSLRRRGFYKDAIFPPLPCAVILSALWSPSRLPLTCTRQFVRSGVLFCYYTHDTTGAGHGVSHVSFHP